MVDVKKRSYRSSIRRGDAPAAIARAAHHLFSTQGYVATSVDAIAAEAGVARPTVFAAVGSKPAILKLVVDQAFVGDDAPVPVAERSWFQEALDEPDAARSLQLHARNTCAISERVGPLLRAVEVAATVDPDVAHLWAALLDQRRTAMNLFTTSLAAKATLRNDTATTADILWAVPDMYLRLVLDGAWSPRRFRDWLAATLPHALLA